eukprot:11216187-Lingulodinium_polyedra.AAC.1
MDVNGPPLRSGAGALLPAGTIGSSMAINEELPWRLGQRALRCSSLWQMLHLRALPKRSFGCLRPLPEDLPPRLFPPK